MPEVSDVTLALTRRSLEKSLSRFLRAAWHVLEPTRDLIWSPHIGVLCDHIQAVEEGRIQNLYVATPPGSTKSMTLCVMYPAWAWARNPGRRFLCAAHKGDLSSRDSQRCRMLLTSPWYRSLWGHVFTFSPDQDAKTYYINSAKGFRQSTSVGAGVMGFRADRLLLDDAHDLEAAESDVQRESVIRWHDEQWYNRVSDFKTCGRIVIGQRLAENDLYGHLIKSGQWECLVLPEEFDSDAACKTSIFADWRKENGELLRPAQFGRDQVAEARKVLGVYGYAAQYLQRPIPREGGFLKRQWFGLVEALPAGPCQECRSWDFAATLRSQASQDPDWTSGVKVRLYPDGTFYVTGRVSERVTPADCESLVRNTALADGHSCTQVLPRDPAAAGAFMALALSRALRGLPHAFWPTNQGDKMVKAHTLAAQAQVGNVRVLNGPWAEQFLANLCAFPKGAHDDDLDAAAQAVNFLARSLSVAREQEARKKQHKEPPRPAGGRWSWQECSKRTAGGRWSLGGDRLPLP